MIIMNGNYALNLRLLREFNVVIEEGEEGRKGIWITDPTEDVRMPLGEFRPATLESIGSEEKVARLVTEGICELFRDKIAIGAAAVIPVIFGIEHDQPLHTDD